MPSRPTSITNRLLAALPRADFDLLKPHLQNVSFGIDMVLLRSGDDIEQAYFPNSGAIAFMVDMPDGQTVATTLMGSEGAVGALSVLGPARSPVSATVRVAGTGWQIPVPKLHSAFARSTAIRHVLQVHVRTQMLQLHHVAACNALHPAERRMARWLLELHDRVADDMLPLTQESMAQLLGVRRTTVTLTMSRLRAAGAIKSERRGLLEIDRNRLESAACECYAVMRSRIGRVYDEELAALRGGESTQQGATVPEVKAASARRE